MPLTQVATSRLRSTVSWLFSFWFLLVFVFSVIILFSPNSAFPLDITLAWDDNKEENLAGYKIFYRENSQGYDYNNPVWQGADTTCTIYNLDDNAVYFFVARAFDTLGNESGDSNEVCHQPSIPPNIAPTADAGVDQTVDEGVTVTLNGSGSTDTDDGSITSHLWTQTAGTSVTLSDPNSVQTTFTAPDVGPDGEALTFQLTVTDNGSLQDTDTCIVNVTWQNKPPTADAGVDQTVDEGVTVTLNGSGSTDTDDGSVTSHLWTQTAGISVTLSDATLARPTFTAPYVGLTGEALTFQLTVSDNGGLTDTDTVTINVSSVNQIPIADAGLGQTVHAGSFVSLDGSGSYDPDGNYTLAYAWEIMLAPQGSISTLSNPSSVNPTFTADLVGDYIIQLVVTDLQGVSSAPDQVRISTENSAPVADASEDQTVIMVNTEVQLDGSQSWDPDGDDITYAWTMATPVGSAAILSDPTAVNPTFVADVPRNYLIRLVVSDGWASSGPDTVKVSFHNTPPVAKAGQNQAVAVGDTVGLDARGSYDANNDALTCSWGIVTRPDGSSATLSDPTCDSTSFVADMAGTYVASLVVNDGYVDSSASTVTVTATSTHDEVIENLHRGIDVINGLDAGDFKNTRMQNTLTNKMNAVLEKVDQGLYDEALDKLEYDILQKTNGCADIGAPDRNEWITNCSAQSQVYPIILKTIELLISMV